MRLTLSDCEGGLTDQPSMVMSSLLGREHSLRVRRRLVVWSSLYSGPLLERSVDEDGLDGVRCGEEDVSEVFVHGASRELLWIAMGLLK